jgi:hypothetical protein
VKLKKTANVTLNFLTPGFWGRRQTSLRRSKRDFHKGLDTWKTPMWQYASSDGNYVEKDEIET